MTFTNSHNLWKGITAIALIALGLVAGLFAEPRTVDAQFSCLSSSFSASSAVDSATKVPVTESTIAANTGFTKQKGCLLDSLAQAAAKVVLQEMTADIVNWINSGFQGNPAFLTNPEAFFLDTADQVTGAFIANSGALSALCSPFNLDIRLNLAMMASKPRIRYTCTLNTVIQNVRRGPRISVGVGQSANGTTIGDIANGNILRDSNQLSVNGRSISSIGGGVKAATVEGFTNGDFSQGGWAAWMAMTGQSENNVIGAYLQSRSDLQSQIAQKEASIQRDLDRSQGFLSWQKCQDTKTYEAGSGEANGEVSPPPGSKVKQNSDGSVTFQSCRTETPGSFISSSLFKQTGSSVDQIVNIHDINDSINQIAQALLFTTLKTGLAALSDADYNSGGISAVDKMAKDIDKRQRENIQQILEEGTDDLTLQVDALLAVRKETVDVLSAEKVLLDQAYVCLSTKTGDLSAQGYASELKQFLNNKVNKSMAGAEQDYNTASTTYGSKLADLNDLLIQIKTAKTTVEVSRLGKKFANATTNPIVSDTAYRKAQNELEAARVVANSWHTEANRYQALCNATTPTN
jgi:hypothetical protein